jgi:ABC-type Fe3+-citrate transport system substrate-binding protein
MRKEKSMAEIIKTFTGSGSIDFEKDQQDAMKKTENIRSLADQVEKLEELQTRLSTQEEIMKDTKKQIEKVSGDIIPTMMSEMGLSELKLEDGSRLKVSTSYRATITEANKEAAFNWLRNNGLGDIIKNEISVSFGRNEDNKAANYAELAKGQGFQPTQKMKVEPMTLKALVRERIEAGKEMPTEIFGVYSENKTTIKRNK